MAEECITVQGNKVREAIKELGITQEELAQRLGMKRETLKELYSFPFSLLRMRIPEDLRWFLLKEAKEPLTQDSC